MSRSVSHDTVDEPDDDRASLERLAEDDNPEIADLAQRYLEHYDELEGSS